MEKTRKIRRALAILAFFIVACVAVFPATADTGEPQQGYLSLIVRR